MFLQTSSFFWGGLSKYKYDTEQVKDKLKKQYDGYHSNNELTDIFYPFNERVKDKGEA